MVELPLDDGIDVCWVDQSHQKASGEYAVADKFHNIGFSIIDIQDGDWGLNYGDCGNELAVKIQAKQASPLVNLRHRSLDVLLPDWDEEANANCV